MITPVMVLRSGGDFLPEHADKLARGLRTVGGLTERAVVLSDFDGSLFTECDRIPLIKCYPGWWSKLELFRAMLFSGPVLFFDLDTIIVGPICDFWRAAESFAMLADFYEPSRLQSGIMAWTPGPHTEYVWDRFVANGEELMKRFRGDANYLRAIIEPRPAVLQDLFPRRIVSYKRDVLVKESPFFAPSGWRIPPGASVVCFHGQPRPWKTPLWGTSNDAVAALHLPN